MIESVLILDAVTRRVLKRVSHDPDRPDLTNLAVNEILSPRHDGDIGWTLTLDNEWIDPAPPTPYPQDLKVRGQRDRLLDLSDRYMISDFPITEEQRTQWQAYRQALRDIPEQPGFPDSVIWPTEPGA